MLKIKKRDLFFFGFGLIVALGFFIFKENTNNKNSELINLQAELAGGKNGTYVIVVDKMWPVLSSDVKKALVYEFPVWMGNQLGERSRVVWESRIGSGPYIMQILDD